MLLAAVSTALAVAAVLTAGAGTAFAQAPDNDNWASAIVVPSLPFPNNGLFKGGHADLFLNAFAYDGLSFDFDDVSQTVTLKGK
jgi:hypothetical protein